MKKYLFIITGFFGFLFADMDIKGLITSIDNSKKTITVNNNIVIQVLPQTVIELDDCGMFGQDIYGRFVDLKVNSFVDVDVILNNYQFNPNQPPANLSYIAEKIELQCNRNFAY